MICFVPKEYLFSGEIIAWHNFPCRQALNDFVRIGYISLCSSHSSVRFQYPQTIPWINSRAEYQIVSNISPNICIAAYKCDLLAVRQAIKEVPHPSQELLNKAAVEALRGRHLDIFRYMLQNGVSVTGDIVTSAACQAQSSKGFQIMYDHGWEIKQISVAVTPIYVMCILLNGRQPWNSVSDRLQVSKHKQ